MSGEDLKLDISELDDRQRSMVRDTVKSCVDSNEKEARARSEKQSLVYELAGLQRSLSEYKGEISYVTEFEDFIRGWAGRLGIRREY
jgi:hypothetical protein